MAKLVLSRGETLVNQYFVDRVDLRIGRAEDNDIVVDDPSLSREHALIHAVGEDHIVEDLQSSNGTFIDGRRVYRQILQHRDIIELGAYQLCYLNSRIAADIDLEGTLLVPGLLRGTPSPSSTGTVAPAVRPGRVLLPGASVRVLAGPEAHGLPPVVVLDRVLATFGLPGEALVAIARRPKGCFLSHVEGTRLPRVNGASVGAGPWLLSHGDIVEAAGYRLEFRLDGVAAAQDAE